MMAGELSKKGLAALCYHAGITDSTHTPSLFLTNTHTHTHTHVQDSVTVREVPYSRGGFVRTTAR